MRIAAALLLAATTAACTSSPSDTTEGTWTVNMTLATAGCFDPEPATVAFLLDVARPQIETAGLVAVDPRGTVTACGGPGQPDGPTVDLSTAQLLPVDAVRVATDSAVSFVVDTSTDPADPMSTTYTLALSGTTMTGDAVYHARPDCTDRWTLTASQGE